MPIILGAVADDDAGATELAGTLADRGMRPILILDELWREDVPRWIRDADAIVIATNSRFADRDAAYEQTRRSIRLLRTISRLVLHVRYSSAPPISPHIGSSVDAAMDETHADFTVALPDLFPEDQAVAERLLAQFQTESKRRAAVVSADDIAQGTETIRKSLARLRGEGVEFAVLDCASEAHLPAIGQAISDLHLVTGSSALAKHLPTSWAPAAVSYPQRRNGGRGFLVVAGTHSPVTQSQNAWLAAHNAVTITLDALNLATGAMPDSALTPLSEELASGGTCLLQTSEDVNTLHDYLRDQNKDESQVREAIARSLATFVRDVISLITPQGLIVAGEETARMLTRMLGVSALAVGPNIEPGIPVCVTLSASALPVVLKPANAGSERFYHHAIEVIRKLEFFQQTG